MNKATRDLIATISEPAADALLRQLRRGARTETELRTKAKLSHRAAHDRLRALERAGLVESVTRVGEGRGRPAREWHLTHAELVERFAEQAEAFARGVRSKS